MAKVIEEVPQILRSRCNHCRRLIEYIPEEIRKKKSEYGVYTHFLVTCPGCKKRMNVNAALDLNAVGEANDGSRTVPRRASEIPWEK
jgi:RNase P subunit RPR2